MKRSVKTIPTTAKPPALSPDMRQELEERADRDTARRAVPGVWVHPSLIAAFALATSYPQTYPATFQIFAGVILFLSAVRGVLLFGRERFFGAYPAEWRDAVHISVLATGLAWGLFAAVTFRLFSPADSAAMLMLGASLGNCTAGVMVLMGRLRLLQVYVLLLLGPPLIALAAPPAAPAMAFMAAIFLVFLLVEGRMLHREYWRSLEDNRLVGLVELAAREAQEAGRARSQFLARVSHELLTPMNGILGMTSLALETDLRPHQREYVSMAHQSAESMHLLIHNLIDYCAIEAGTLGSRRKEFGVRDVVRISVDGFARAAKARQLDLTWEVDAAVPDELVGDSRWLAKLISCLVDNGIKYTERGGVDVKVSVWNRGRSHIDLLLMIADTGVGIPPDRQEMIFEAFRPADTSPWRNQSGLGLGLRAVARLAEQLDGQVWLESHVGRGTRFFVTARFHTGGLAGQDDEPGKKRKNVFVVWRNPEAGTLALRGMK